MLRLLRALTLDPAATSVVWLYDGLYVNQGMPRAEVRRAFDEAAAEAGFPQLTLRISDIQMPQPRGSQRKQAVPVAARQVEGPAKKRPRWVWENMLDAPFGRPLKAPRKTA